MDLKQSIDISIPDEAKNLNTLLSNTRFTQVIKDSKEKELVIFLGVTRAGKSTCISYLLGGQFNEIIDVGTSYAELCTDELDKKFPEIGHGDYDSCTIYSEIFDDATSGLTYCDTAGFLDTRQAERNTQICTSLSTQLAIQSAKGIKALVVVIEWSTFRQTTCKDLKKLMTILNELLYEPMDVSESLFFLINKIPNNVQDKHYVHQSIALCSENLPHPLEKNVLYLLKKVVQDKTTVTTHFLGERSKVLSKEFYDALMGIQSLPPFPGTAENPISIHRDKNFELFREINLVCGYARDFDRVIYRYQKKLFTDIYKFNQKLIKTADDMAELKALNRIAYMIGLLDKQLKERPENIILMDVFDHGEKREAIQQLLVNKKTTISKERFNFKSYDKNRRCFNETLEQLALDGKRLIQDYFALVTKKEETEKNQQNTQAQQDYHTAFHDFVRANDEVTFSSIKNRFTTLINKEIQRLSAQHQHCLDKITELENKQFALQQEQIDLDQIASTLIFQEDFHEPAAPLFQDWERSKSLFRTEKQFIYPLKIPYLSHLTTGNGSFEASRRNAKESGICEIIYTSCFGENARASFSVFAEKRRVPANHLRLSQIADELPQTVTKIKAHRKKAKTLTAEIEQLNILLLSIENTSFQTSGAAREDMERQFEARFKSERLFDEHSVIWLCSENLPPVLEKNALYLLKTLDRGDQHLSIHRLEESSRMLSQVACQDLFSLPRLASFPKASENPVNITRKQYGMLFQKIVSLCGYVINDPEPKGNFYRTIKEIEENLLGVRQTLEKQKASYQLLQDLSQWFTPTPTIKDFLTDYMAYQKQCEKEMALASLNAQHCLQQIESFNVMDILEAKEADLEPIQETLELLGWGTPPKTYASKKAQALIGLCNAYLKTVEARSMDLVTSFQQFLKMIQKYPEKSNEVEFILKSILWHHFPHAMTQDTFENLLALYLDSFSLTAEEGQKWLHTVVERGNLRATQCLLNKGADITSRNDKGQTVIFVAAIQRNVALLKQLLAHGRLDLHRHTDSLKDDAQNHLLHELLKLPFTPILLAIIETLNHHGAVYPLLNHPQHKVPFEDQNFHRLIEGLTFQSVLDLNFFAELDHHSVSFKLCKILLQPLNHLEKQQCLMMTYQNESLLAFILRRHQGEWEKAKLIFSFFIPEEAPLHDDLLVSSIQTGQVEFLTFLFERCKAPLNLNRTLPYQKSLLSISIQYHQPKIIELLLKYQANPHQPASYTPCLSHTHQKPLSNSTFLSQHLYLTDDFIIRSSTDNGGAFFDAFAQVVNNLIGAPLYNETALREICYRYYQKNVNEVLALQETTIPETTYDRIRFCAEKLPQGKVLVGRPQVEGIMLCRALNLDVIYLAEVEHHIETLNPGSPNQIPSTQQDAEPSIQYYTITKKAYQPIQKVEMPNETPFLLFSKVEGHVVPVLRPSLASPLQLSVLENHLPSLKCLLALKPKPALINAQENSQTVFHIAAILGQLETLKLLESSIPLPDKYDWLFDKDAEGSTPFLLAIQYQHLDCVQWMLTLAEKYTQERRNESISLLVRLLTTSNRQGQTPIELAIQSHQQMLIQALLARGTQQFWQDEMGQSAVQSLLSNQEIPAAVLRELKASKMKAGVELIKKQLCGLLSQHSLHKHFLEPWSLQLEKVLQEPHYQNYRESFINAPLSSIQTMAEPLAKRIAHTIQDRYHSPEHKTELQTHVDTKTYHAWWHLLHQAIDGMLTSVSHQVQGHQLPRDSIFSQKKTYKHRAFTRALKDALRNYFYVSRALYEGKVLMNDEGFNAFKAIFNVASPIATEISSTLTNVNFGLISGFVSAALELVTRLRDAKYQCEAGRFVQAFGLCQPDAIEKCKKDISIDHDKLKAVAESLYQRYRDQIEQCTLSKEADISLRLADTDGIYVLANIMADRIFQHIIKKQSIKVEDDRTVFKQFSDWFETIGSDNDIYKEHPLISLPERCILAVIYECVGEDKEAHIRTDRWLLNRCKTEDVWQAGGILVKTGLKLERNPTELYIRAGNDEQKSLHAKYGYCYVSDGMVYLKEIEKRGFQKASQTHLDLLVDPLTPTDQKTVAPCFVM